MTTKKLITLAAAAAVLGGLAYVSTNTRKLKTPALTGKPVLAALDISAVQRIEVSDDGQKTLILESADSGWTVKTLFGYPADIVKIREHLLTLADLKIGQVAAAGQLGHARVVDLQNASGKSLATLRLGEKHLREATGQMAMYGGGAYPDGRYVATERDTVYLVAETLDAFDGDPKRWVDTQLTSIQGLQIATAEFTADGETLKLEKKDGAWALDGLGEQEELDTSKLFAVDNALGNLHFTSIADPALTDEQLGMVTGAVYKVTFSNGATYTATLGAASGSDRYFKISATFTSPEPDAEAAGHLQQAQGLQNKIQAAAIEVFNAKHANWVYLIPAHTAGNMTRCRADVVKAKETEAPAPADASE